MADILATILAEKKDHIAARKKALSQHDLEEKLKTLPPPRGFLRRLRHVEETNGPALICEIKKASPSKGLIRADFDPLLLASAYETGGAACLSVLTDGPYFQGQDPDLAAARAAAPSLPALRKDFMLDPYQIYESRALGADAVLLILAALGTGQAQELEAAALVLGMDVLLEVHDEAELERALGLSSPLLGINNRDLKSLRVDLATFERLAPQVPAGHFLVAESGLTSAEDIKRLQASGARAFLIGERLMQSPDVSAATAELLAGVRA